jgi:hypothetical protein
MRPRAKSIRYQPVVCWPESHSSRPKDRLFSRRPAGWYLIDFARSRHTNPARTPVVVTADWYQSFDGLV